MQIPNLLSKLLEVLGLAVLYVSPEWAGESGRSPKAEEQAGNGARASVPVLPFETGCIESL